MKEVEDRIKIENEWELSIFHKLQSLEAELRAVEYTNMPKIYSDIRKSVTKMMIDLDFKRIDHIKRCWGEDGQA